MTFRAAHSLDSSTAASVVSFKRGNSTEGFVPCARGIRERSACI